MRPRFLYALAGIVLLFALAGCSASGSIQLTPVDEAGLAEQASHSLPHPDDEEALDRRRIVTEAVSNGSSTANGTRPPIDPGGLPFEVDGAYYDLSATPIDNHTETRVSVSIDYNGTTDGPGVDYSALSPRDKALLSNLLPPPDDRRVEGYDLGAGGRYTDDEVADSTLLDGEYDAVVYDGERYPIEVRSEGTVTVSTYRYTATQVAPDAESYAGQLIETKQFTLTGLSDAERSVLEEALNDTYYAESDDDSAFESLAKRFQRHEAVERDEYGGSWVVEYRDSTYWADLDYSGFESLSED